MGLSHPDSFAMCMHTVIALKPKSVLDVGCGFGMFGLGFRIYGAAWHNYKLKIEESYHSIRVDGVEICENHVQAWHDIFYDHIFMGNVVELAGSLPNYDVLYMGDCLEHLTEMEASLAIPHLWSRADRLFMLAFPCSTQVSGPRNKFGNDRGGHLTAWVPERVAEMCPGATVWKKRLPGQWFTWLWKESPVELKCCDDPAYDFEIERMV